MDKYPLRFDELLEAALSKHGIEAGRAANVYVLHSSGLDEIQGLCPELLIDLV